MMSKILIFLLALSSFLFSQSDFKVLSSNQNSIIIEYTPQFTDTSVQVIDNQKYRNVELTFGLIDNSIKVGTPAVSERQLNIGVPNETGNVIRVLSTAYREIDGKVTPLQSVERDKLLESITYNISPEYNNYVDFPELVSFGDYGISRGLSVQTIRIFPIKFDVNTNVIRLYSKIVFQIDYGFGQTAGKKTEDELLKYSVINYDAAKYWIKSNKNQLSKFGSSVLANGQWVKFEAPDEGIYKIDKATLESFGFDLISVDPRTIKIYNNGGKKLSEKVNDPRPVDLVENAITVIGENDGSFDDGDYILFYGRGTQLRDFDPATKTIKRFNNPFANKNYYFITVGGNNGKRIQNKASLNTTPDIIQTSTIAFADYEVDKINLAKSGREFFGDDFSQSVPGRTYLNKLDGRISSIPINYRFRFVNASQNSFTLSVSENSSNIFTQVLAGFGNASYTFGVDYTRNATYNGALSENRSTLNFSISSNSVNNIGYLDYFEITYEKQLQQFDNKILFFSKDSTAIVEYYLNGFMSSDINVFDVSDPYNVKMISPENGWPSGGDYKFQIIENADTLRKYLAIGNSTYLNPVNPSTVENQDLRGISEGAKYIIIYNNNFKEAAERLKTYRESEARIPISTIIVDVDKIYNEFACGSKDISGIRDFLKYAYDNWQNKPEYFLLMGKGTYDYKNVEGFGDNFVPTWETEESLI
ncbi:MAG: C25 family cysteine peptidase, partial [Ignavibacteriaceae bacterium]